MMMMMMMMMMIYLFNVGTYKNIDTYEKLNYNVYKNEKIHMFLSKTN